MTLQSMHWEMFFRNWTVAVILKIKNPQFFVSPRDGFLPRFANWTLPSSSLHSDGLALSSQEVVSIYGDYLEAGRGNKSRPSWTVTMPPISLVTNRLLRLEHSMENGVQQSGLSTAFFVMASSKRNFSPLQQGPRGEGSTRPTYGMYTEQYVLGLEKEQWLRK